jgi:hypothetical protein
MLLCETVCFSMISLLLSILSGLVLLSDGVFAIGFCNMSNSVFSLSTSGYLYFRSPQRVFSSFATAQNFCRSTHPDARLAILRDANATYSLLYLWSYYTYSYVGLVQNSTAVEPAGNWFWLDDTPYGYWSGGTWNSSQPNNNGSNSNEQNCAVTDNYGALNDVECNTTLFSVFALCEVHGKALNLCILCVDIVYVVSNCSSQVACPTGSIVTGESCSACPVGTVENLCFM